MIVSEKSNILFSELRKITNYAKVVLRRRQEQGMRTFFEHLNFSNCY